MGHRLICCDIRGNESPPGSRPSEAIVRLLDWMGGFASRNGLEQPMVLSACRTWDQQKKLQQQWDSGDRSGLAARPVDPARSKHVAGGDGICRAVDLANSRVWLARWLLGSCEREGLRMQSPKEEKQEGCASRREAHHTNQTRTPLSEMERGQSVMHEDRLPR